MAQERRAEVAVRLVYDGVAVLLSVSVARIGLGNLLRAIPVAEVVDGLLLISELSKLRLAGLMRSTRIEVSCRIELGLGVYTDSLQVSRYQGLVGLASGVLGCRVFKGQLDAVLGANAISTLYPTGIVKQLVSGCRSNG